MEIRKADSKGRVTGFEPGELYAFNRDRGHFSPVGDLLKAEYQEMLTNPEQYTPADDLP